jgi:hypothetical protein
MTSTDTLDRVTLDEPRRKAVEAARKHLRSEKRDDTGRFLYPADIALGPGLTARERQELAIATFINHAIHVCTTPPQALPWRDYKPLLASMDKVAETLRLLARGQRYKHKASRGAQLDQVASIVEELIEKPFNIGVIYIGRERGNLGDKAMASSIVSEATQLFQQQFHGVVANLMSAFLEKDITREMVRDWCKLS